MDGTKRLGTSRLLCVEMLNLISKSVKLYQTSVGARIASSQTCMPQLAACNLVARVQGTRSYSMASLREWAMQAQVVRSQDISQVCTQPSMFALQVSKVCLQFQQLVIA